VVDTPAWTAPYGFPDDLAAAIGELTASASGILLGRATYEMFAPAWSTRSVDDDPGAAFFNETPKHVVSSTLTDPSWGPVKVLAYEAGALRDLKRRSEGDLYVSGSATLVRSLLADDLVDELHLFVYPLALGSGLRLFAEDSHTSLALLGAAPLSNGAVHLTYGPAEG
jgi:dihydrofolate reductase